MGRKKHRAGGPRQTGRTPCGRPWQNTAGCHYQWSQSHSSQEANPNQTLSRAVGLVLRASTQPFQLPPLTLLWTCPRLASAPDTHSRTCRSSRTCTGFRIRPTDSSFLSTKPCLLATFQASFPPSPLCLHHLDRISWLLISGFDSSPFLVATWKNTCNLSRSHPS